MSSYPFPPYSLYSGLSTTSVRQSVENLLKMRFGDLDETLAMVVGPLLNLPAQEYIPLLVDLSREELISRFSEENL